MDKILIAPSILSADFAYIGDAVEKLERSGADYIHCDVMDGRFVPNITFGIPMVKDIKKCTKLPLDIHLMIVEPDKYVERFIEAGADIVSFHPEIAIDAHNTVRLIKNKGAKAGIVLNPDIPADAAAPYINEADIILLMSVFPGFGGQKFIPSVLEKITAVKDMVKESGRNINIEIDGGITEENVKDATSRGVNIIVAGNTIFKSKNMAKTIARLRK